MMKDDDFKLLRGFDDEQTDGWTDNICECRVAFATENIDTLHKHNRFPQKFQFWIAFFLLHI